MPFNFCPIEPPRPRDTGAETFARRKHQFVPAVDIAAKAKGKSSIFTRKSFANLTSASKAEDTSPVQIGPLVSVEARLPEPPILTCGSDIPLRIICSGLNGHTQDLLLQSIEICIAQYTPIQAHDIVRTESSAVVILSRSNINAPIVFNSGSSDTVIDSSLWRGLPIPANLPPSFETCNVKRNYELILRIGIRYQQPKSHPQNTTIELRMPFKLFSGIRPPAELLRSMSNVNGVSGGHESKTPALPPREKPIASQPGPSMPFLPPAATTEEEWAIYRQIWAERKRPYTDTAQTTAPSGHAVPVAVESAPPGYSEAPPSYEDAIADTMPAVAADTRPEYAPPPPAEGDDSLLPTDEKRGWH